MASYYVIGLSTGPGLSGLDAALVETDVGAQPAFKVVHWQSEPLPRDLRALLVRASTPEQGDARALAVANEALGEVAASVARLAADRASVSLQAVLAIGWAGFTAWHEIDQRTQATLTLGTPARIAERTGITVVDDFRARDVAAGGQGLPLGAATDQILFGDEHETRLVIHLGSLTHVTLLPAQAEFGGVVAALAGPGNLLLDALVQELSSGKERYDVGGRLAVQGCLLPELLARWTKHPFALRKPPRGLHRSTFAEEFARQTVAVAQQQGWRAHDLICTATHYVAWLIGDSVRRLQSHQFPIARAIVTGGGAKNGLFWQLLGEQLGEVSVERSDDFDVPAEARGAVDPALLATLAVAGTPANVPLSTGARGPRLLGRFTPGSPANWARCLEWMTGQRRDFDEE